MDNSNLICKKFEECTALQVSNSKFAFREYHFSIENLHPTLSFGVVEFEPDRYCVEDILKAISRRGIAATIDYSYGSTERFHNREPSVWCEFTAYPIFIIGKMWCVCERVDRNPNTGDLYWFLPLCDFLEDGKRQKESYEDVRR